MMFTMRSHHMLTDVVLEVGNELFHVHKVVLAAGSPYFKVSIYLLEYTIQILQCLMRKAIGNFETSMPYTQRKSL